MLLKMAKQLRKSVFGSEPEYESFRANPAPAELLLQRPGMALLDRIPARLEVTGHILHCGMAPQLHPITSQHSGPPLFGKADPDRLLPQHCTGPALQPVEVKGQKNRLVSHRYGPDLTDTLALPDHRWRATDRTWL